MSFPNCSVGDFLSMNMCHVTSLDLADDHLKEYQKIMIILPVSIIELFSKLVYQNPTPELLYSKPKMSLHLLKRNSP